MGAPFLLESAQCGYKIGSNSCRFELILVHLCAYLIKTTKDKNMVYLHKNK